MIQLRTAATKGWGTSVQAVMCPFLGTTYGGPAYPVSSKAVGRIRGEVWACGKMSAGHSPYDSGLRDRPIHFDQCCTLALHCRAGHASAKQSVAEELDQAPGGRGAR